MRLFDLRKLPHRPERPTRWHYWPIGLGWCPGGGHALICWHGWSMDGSSLYPDATATDCGWTLHLGAVKVYFGKRNPR